MGFAASHEQQQKKPGAASLQQAGQNWRQRCNYGRSEGRVFSQQTSEIHEWRNDRGTSVYRILELL